MTNEPITNRPKAVLLTGAARWAFGVGSVLCAGTIVAILLWLTSPWPDLLLGVLGVGVLICGVFATIGRLPSGFEVAGLRFQFEAEELSNLISTVRGALDDDPDGRDEILRLIKEGTGSKAFREADSLSATPSAGSMPDIPVQVEATGGGEEVKSPGSAKFSGQDPKAFIRSVLEKAFVDEDIRERFSVPTGSSGKRPIFDFYIESANLVVEFEQYWNDSTVDLIARKSARALEKVTPVEKVVVVTPGPGVKSFRKQIDNDAVIIDALEDFTPTALRLMFSESADRPS